MFIGHFAVGFASKRLAPRAPLGPLMAAPLLLDLIWPIFLLAGWEEVRIAPGNTAFTPLDFVRYPYSHSLATAAGWALLFGAVYWVYGKYQAGAVVIGFSVVSHWVLDALAHRPDLPLYPCGATRLGAGLWNSVAGTLAVESLMFAVGLWLYATMTRARDGAGRWGFWLFVAFLILIYFGNAFGPPPPNLRALLATAFGAWILPFWAAWFDRHRAV